MPAVLDRGAVLNLRTEDGVVHLMKFGGSDDGHDETECGLFLVTNPEFSLRRLNNNRHELLAAVTDRKLTCVTCLAEEDQPWRTPQ